MALSIGVRSSISLLSAIQATRPLTITLVGLSPTEHTSFFLDTPPYGGFSRYGFKAGLSDEAFPRRRFAFVLRAPQLPSGFPARCQGRCADKHLRASGLPLYPRGPRSGPGYAVPVHLHLTGPICPNGGTSRFHRLAAYTRCLRCACSSMPRRPTTGSGLSSMLSHNMSSSTTTGNSSVAYTQYFTEDIGLQLRMKVSAFPSSSHCRPAQFLR